MVGEPLKPERIAGDLLVLDQGRCPTVHCAQRRKIWRGNAKAFAEMPPEQRRNDPNRVEEPAAHPQKAYLQGEPKLELGPSAFLDDPGLVGRELEEHLDLKGRHLARQVPQTEKRRVPAVHRVPPKGRTIDPCRTRSASR